jgi:membrane-bound metal-dependent hydrolase YbcI (DUF457 family)
MPKHSETNQPILNLAVMKLPEHLALSFLLAQFGVQQQFGPAGTTLVIAAGVLPDLDGISILGGWQCHRTYHRVVGHGLLAALAGPGLLAYLGWAVFDLAPLLPLWIWLQASLVVHLLTDVCFYRWPVQLLWPFSSWGVGFGLIAWNDLVPTVVLYSGALLTLLALSPVIPWIAVAAVGAYILVRAWFPRPRAGWSGWLTGEWARHATPVWRWLTGDFIT